MLDTLRQAIDPALLSLSGKVFYSGSAAFSGEAEAYLLGYNPGGDPIEEGSIGDSLAALGCRPDLWSAYLDESWKGHAPGESPLQRRMRHLCERAGLDLRKTPASNLIFVRSRQITTLSGRSELADRCWRFHAAVLDRLRPRVVLSFGGQTFAFMARKLGVCGEIVRFTEASARRWSSVAVATASGQILVGLTHPARADWTNPACDPSDLVRQTLAAHRSA